MNPPTDEDFRSFALQGRQPRDPDPEVLRLWDGVSVYDSKATLRRLIRNRPHLGTFIAELAVPDDGSVRFEKTRGAGHYTLWASPLELRRMVIHVLAVEDTDEGQG
jgi:hypothetical protein